MMIAPRTILSEVAYLLRRLIRRVNTNSKLTAANPIGTFEWNELPADQGEELNDALVSLVAFDGAGTPTALGTGFVVQAQKRSAGGVTAAHVLWDAASKAQQPFARAHPTTPSFFRSDFEEVQIGPRRLRAAFVNRGKAALPSVTWVVWDKRADVAFFTVNSGDEDDPGEFEAHFPIDQVVPKVGERVGILGYGDVAAETPEPGRDFRTFSVMRRLVLRVGRVRAAHPNGHILCRAPCIETSIPVLPGMSGGPAFRIPKPGGQIRAFGLVSGDPKEPIELKQNRWHRGSSIIALLPIESLEENGPLRSVALRVEDIGVGRPGPV